MAHKEFKTGYGKPPKHSQYKPGQSGNPKGRPKKVPKSAVEMIGGELYKMVKVKEGDKVKSMAKIEAVTKKLVQDAMAGKPAAVKLILDINEKFLAKQEAEPMVVGWTETSEKLLQEIKKEYEPNEGEKTEHE